MVCEKCEAKVQKVICPDVWKEGANNTNESGGRELNENRILSSRKKGGNRFNPYSRKCKICRGTISQQGAYYCQTCAYQKGICSMCGVKVLDTTYYKQSTV